MTDAPHVSVPREPTEAMIAKAQSCFKPYADLCGRFSDGFVVELYSAMLAAAPPSAQIDEGAVERLTDRFLAWRLPDSVCSDMCATTQGYPNRSGTNLLTSEEARQMIEHLFSGIMEGVEDAARQEATRFFGKGLPAADFVDGANFAIRHLAVFPPKAPASGMGDEITKLRAALTEIVADDAGSSVYSYTDPGLALNRCQQIAKQALERTKL